jgi:predicted DNA-binding transcriptional regulator AlpA
MEQRPYQFIYDEFARYFPLIHENVVSWKESGKLEITVYLNDGTSGRYDLYTHNYSHIPNRPDGMLTDEEWAEEFGRRLRREMRIARISQPELAERVGVSRVTIWSYVSGRTMPTGRNISAIAHALGIPKSVLIDF